MTVCLMAGRKSLTRHLKHKPIFSLSALFCIFIAFALWLVINKGNVVQFFHHYNERNKELMSVRVLEKNIRDLEEQKKALEYGGFENEKIIRERYHMIKPGEKIILLEMEEEKK